MTHDRIRRALGATLVALAPIALVVAWLLTRHDLGPRVAAHFDGDGHADGFQSPGSLVFQMGLVCTAIAAVGVGLILASRTVARQFTGAIAGAAWVTSTTTIAVLLANRGVAPEHAHSGFAATAVSVLVAIGLGVAAAWTIPPSAARGTVQDTPPSYRLAPGERASWFGSARSRALGGLGLVLAVAGGAVFAAGHVVGVYLALIGLIVVYVHSLDVRVDADGVVAHFGPIAWPAVRIRMGDIEAVRAEEIEPMRWGGWGYRLGRRGTALVVRRGPGLVIARRNRSDIAITVDRAQDAAALIAAYRAGAVTPPSAPGSPSAAR